MKIYLSKYWRFNCLCEVIMIFLLVAGTTAFCLWFRTVENYIMVLCCAIFVSILAVALFLSKKFLTYVIYENRVFTSFTFFGKQCCKVYGDKAVYYAKFISPQGQYGLKEFVAVSNEPFDFQPTYGKAHIRFIQHYNLNKIVVFPYDETIIPLLRVDEWHCVGQSDRLM